MTNLEKWNLYFSNIGAPQSFIDWGFYSLIAASLQRRVWINSDTHPIFPNIYTVLCGDPGIGKGLVIGPVNNILRHHKKRKEPIEGEPNEKDVNYATQDFFSDNRSKLNSLNNTLIAVAPQATSHQALILAMADSYTGIRFFNKKTGKPDVLRHSSVVFCLEEISSLFRSHTEDLARFLLEAYDCRPDYTYITISRKTDRILWPCLNFLAGTTPTFMQRIFNTSIIDEGFSSRTFFICEDRNRFNKIVFPEPSLEMLQANADILAHVKYLTEICGKCEYTKEAFDYLDNWWSKKDETPRPNSNPKLDHYYSRKNLHVQKLSMILHFSEMAHVKENPDLTITLEEVVRAMDILAKAEMKMHLAITFAGDSLLSKRAAKLTNHLKQKNTSLPRKELTKVEIWKFLWDDLDNPGQLDEILDAMLQTQKIGQRTREVDNRVVYFLMEK